jgi:anthranilate 1,2-dioxygenase (deaminating, decarboxylating) large subunit
MRKTFAALLLAALALGLAGTPALAFNQPPLNLGLTDILDGGPPGPGTYFTEYIQAYDANEFKDGDGNGIPGNPKVANLLSMNQLVHVYQHKLLGGHIGATALLPVVAISGSGTFGPPNPAPPGAPMNAVTTNPAVLGDLIVGPFLQWFDTKLLGRPFIHRLELDIVMPTGQYDKGYAVNPGSNVWTFEPFYAFTWFLTDKLSTSWRIMYDFHTENDDAAPSPLNNFSTSMTPGQVFHFNYSFEYEFFKNFRGAVAGYYLKQTTDDDSGNGKVGNSKEEVFAAGPAVFWIVSPNFSMGLKTAWETSVENRPEGNRTTFRMTYKF